MVPPVIIVSAGRSGSKLLRSILASHPDVVAFPREINYIWRHGNADHPTDALRPECARPEVARYVRKRFDRMAGTNEQRRVVEKTCANSLRVEFVHKIFPEAHIVHLVRDGRAVAESARRRWQASPDLSYLLEKARWVPFSDLPHYAWRYIRYQMKRWKGKEGAQGSWGPRFEGLDRLVAERPLLEVCAIQWRKCLKAAEASLDALPSELATTVRYEELVRHPRQGTARLLERLRLRPAPQCKSYAESEIRSDYLDRWKSVLSGAEQRIIQEEIGCDLRRLKYEI